MTLSKRIGNGVCMADSASRGRTPSLMTRSEGSRLCALLGCLGIWPGMILYGLGSGSFCVSFPGTLDVLHVTNDLMNRDTYIL